MELRISAIKKTEAGKRPYVYKRTMGQIMQNTIISMSCHLHRIHHQQEMMRDYLGNLPSVSRLRTPAVTLHSGSSASCAILAVSFLVEA